jgi:hypothetical protein
MVTVRLSKGMRPLDGSTDIGDDNIKTNVTLVERGGLDSYGPGLGPVVGSHSYGNETSVSITFGEFLDKRRYC